MDSTGFRYNDLFPLFVSQRVGMHFFAAVWEQAKSTEQILQTMTRLLDKPRVQCMVQEYSARLALGDFMELSSSVQGFGERADVRRHHQHGRHPGAQRRDQAAALHLAQQHPHHRHLGRDLGQRQLHARRRREQGDARHA